MKKSILLFLLSAFFLASYAQVKKVAILPTVDQVENVGYGVLFQVRTSLTYAISNTPGYEGYDRVDLAAIMGEHDFQRTGNVSEDQIKALGKMTGAAYVLIAEAVVYDEQHIMIAAKILDVETGGVINSSKPEFASKEPTEMSEACMRICKTLFGEINTNSSYDSNYVDLGLPSGTRWAKTNEGGDGTFYTYNEAVNKFGGKLPSDNQFYELIEQCTWIWNGKGYTVTGPNGAVIYFPADGYRSCDGILTERTSSGSYYSSSVGDACQVLYFTSNEVGVYKDSDCSGLSVRLVEDSFVNATTNPSKSINNLDNQSHSLDNSNYVDLGLPSGTLWCKTNEGGDYVLYTYEDAVQKFGSRLPTNEQFEELMDLCSWNKIGKRYQILGPNGNVIYLPAAGECNCDGEISNVDSYACYWSSTSKFPDCATSFSIREVWTMQNNMNLQCFGLSVRLVMD